MRLEIKLVVFVFFAAALLASFAVTGATGALSVGKDLRFEMPNYLLSLLFGTILVLLFLELSLKKEELQRKLSKKKFSIGTHKKHLIAILMILIGLHALFFVFLNPQITGLTAFQFKQEADLTIFGAVEDGLFGFDNTGDEDLVHVLDFDGDGIDDQAIAEVAAYGYGYGGERLQQGRVYIFYGQNSSNISNVSINGIELIVTKNVSNEKDLDLALDEFDVRIFGRVLRETAFGRSLSSGDVNNDGFDDLIIGDAFDGSDLGTGTRHEGRVYVVFGSDNLSGEFEVVEIANATIQGENEDDNYGFRVASGDYNDDSFDDIISAAPGFDSDININPGPHFVNENTTNITMPCTVTTGIDAFSRLRIGCFENATLAPQQSDPPDPPLQPNIKIGEGNTIFVARLIGDPGRLASLRIIGPEPTNISEGLDPECSDPIVQGAGVPIVDVIDLQKCKACIDGKPSCVSGVNFACQSRPLPAGFYHVVQSILYHEKCGSGFICGCDFDAPFIEVSGTPDDNPNADNLTGTGGRDVGRVYFVHGELLRDEIDGGTDFFTVSVSTVDTVPNVTVTGKNEDDRIGQSLYVTEGNGDSFEDVVIGAPSVSFFRGEVYSILGAALLPTEFDTSKANITFRGISTPDQAGFAVSAGDFDGDGIHDYLIGAPGRGGSLASVDPNARFGPSGNGEVYAVFSSSTLDGTFDLSDANITLTGIDGNDQAGFDVSAGDVDFDGFADIVVGAPTATSGAKNQRLAVGKAYLRFSRGNTGTFSLADADAIFIGENDNDELGFTVSTSDLNNDTCDDIIIGAPFADGPLERRPNSGEAYVWLGCQEICDNGRDDDGDGLVDCADEEDCLGKIAQNGGRCGGGGGGSDGTKCPPRWECDPWSSCIAGNRTRQCIDVSGCPFTRPPMTEQQPCTVNVCTPNWQCNSWGSCVGGSQSRNCFDLNTCNSTLFRPPQSKPCSAQPVLEKPISLCPFGAPFSPNALVGTQIACGCGSSCGVPVPYNYSVAELVERVEVGIPQGYEMITNPFTLYCDCQQLDFTLNLANQFTDIRTLKCHDGVCEDLTDYTSVSEDLTCGGLTSRELRQQRLALRKDVLMPDELPPIFAEGSKLNAQEPSISTGVYKLVFTGIIPHDFFASLHMPTGPVPIPKNPSLSILGSPLVVEVQNTDFALPAKLTMPYPALVGFEEESVGIYYRQNSNWRFLGGSIDTDARTITVEFEDLYAVLDEGTAEFAVIGIACDACTETKFENVYDPGSRDAIILVHGFLSSPLTWQPLIDNYVWNQQPWQIWTFGYPYSKSIEEIADEFADHLEQYSAQYDRIYIVAHSLGALVAQEALHRSTGYSYREKVRKFILVGSPNDGSPSAAVYQNLFRFLVNQRTLYRPFNTQSTVMKDLVQGRQVPRVKDIEYYVVAGRRPYEFNVGFFKVTTEELIEFILPNDGILTTESAQHVGYTYINDTCLNYYELDLSHTELIDHPLSQRIIKRIIAEEKAQDEPERALVGYNQYLRLQIPVCNEQDVYVVIGKRIAEVETSAPMLCNCGDGICGMDENEENCPIDCARISWQAPLCKFLPSIVYTLLLIALGLTVAYGVRKYGYYKEPSMVWPVSIVAIVIAGILGLTATYLICRVVLTPAYIMAGSILLMVIFDMIPKKPFGVPKDRELQRLRQAISKTGKELEEINRKLRNL